MDDIDKLIAQYPQYTFEFEPMPCHLKGLMIGNQITIDSNLSKEEQLQWMYEELGHIATTVGDITDYKKAGNMSDENVARHWGMRHLIPKEKLDKLVKHQFETDDEVADDLGVQTNYLHEAGIMYGFHYKSLK